MAQYYRIEEKALIASAEVPEEALYIAYLSLAELRRDATKLGLEHEALELLQEQNLQNTLTVWDDFSLGLLTLPDVVRAIDHTDLIGIYLDSRKLLIIDLWDSDHSTEKCFATALGNKMRELSLGRVLYLFIKELTKGHFQHYSAFQRQINELERSSLETQDKSQQIEHRLSTVSHDMLVLHSYYEELSDFLTELEENENEILSDDDLGYIRSLLARIDHYSNNMKFLREYLAVVRESYQAQVDLKMNEIMKIFTVLTAVFLPLTLLVGWYGMNFKNMPELDWRYGYLSVILASIALTVGILYYFKRKKLF